MRPFWKSISSFVCLSAHKNLTQTLRQNSFALGHLLAAELGEHPKPFLPWAFGHLLLPNCASFGHLLLPNSASHGAQRFPSPPEPTDSPRIRQNPSKLHFTVSYFISAFCNFLKGSRRKQYPRIFSAGPKLDNSTAEIGQHFRDANVLKSTERCWWEFKTCWTNRFWSSALGG